MQGDVIVVGVGGMGSAVCRELAMRGAKVIGVEQFAISHANGSSHGDSRMIREAYFEHPNYVQLLRLAYAGWRDLEAASQMRLLHTPGVVIVGREQGSVLTGVRRSADLYNIKIEKFDHKEAASRFPGLRVPEEYSVLFEPGAGFLEVERCVTAYAEEARRLGAILFENETVHKWEVKGAQIIVTTDKRQMEAERLVITAGAWAQRILVGLRLPLKVYKMMMLWFEEQTGSRGGELQPGFIYDLDLGFFYGLPKMNDCGVKLGKHNPEIILPDPSRLHADFQSDEFLSKPIEKFAQEYLIGLSGRQTRRMPCMYTMTPDGHFIIDKHPEHENVVFAAGFSGHGFKFAPAIGNILADLTLNGSSHHPYHFLKLNRFDRML